MKKRQILVVDDDATCLALAEKILGNEYRVATVNSGQLAFKYLATNVPDLILLDLTMPGMDGFKVMDVIREQTKFSTVPIIFVTASQDSKNVEKCLERGAADFVTKPFLPNVLKSRVRHAFELYDYRRYLESTVGKQEELITEGKERISRMQDAIILSMANLIEFRDVSTGKHIMNTQRYVEMVCNALYDRGLFGGVLTDEYRINTIKAAPLHDIGKVMISDVILKKPGKLTEVEFEEMKKHTEYGVQIIDATLGDVEAVNYISIAREIALFHHERWDGKGYPQGLKGNEIPLCARIMAIADVFDALYEERVYKDAVRPMGNTMAVIASEKGKHFDPVITDVFMELNDTLLSYVGEKSGVME